MVVDTTQNTAQPAPVQNGVDPRKLAQGPQQVAPAMAYGQLGFLQQVLAQILMYFMSFLDPENGSQTGLNKLFAGIMGMDDTQYRGWRNDVKAHDGEWESRTDFSKTDFSKARAVVLNPPQNLLDLISTGEHSQKNHETGQSYNTAFGNRHVNFTGMTINEVLAWQNNDPGNSAAGRYQIIEKTLRGLKNEMGLSGNEKFDQDMQDKMAGVLMERRGLSKFLNGDMSESQFMRNMSMEWASLPKDMAGKSYYHGDGLNKAHVPPQAVVAVLRAEREQKVANALTRETGSAANKYDPDGAVKVSAQPVSLAFAKPAQGIDAAQDQTPDPQRPAPVIPALAIQ